VFGIAWPGRIVLEKLQRGLDAGGANSRLASWSSWFPPRWLQRE